MADECDEKRCTLCGETKPLVAFVRYRRARDGRASWCRACHAAKSKKWREDNPEKARETRRNYQERNPGDHRKQHLRRSYGIELEDYERLLATQEGRCAICRRTESDAAKSFLCVDHIAGTAIVRGLLCSPCNAAIGLLAHDPGRLTAAILYLAGPPAFEGTLIQQGRHRTGPRSQ